MFRTNLSDSELVREARLIEYSSNQAGKDAVNLHLAKKHTLMGGDPLSIRFRCGQIADIISGEIIPRMDR